MGWIHHHWLWWYTSSWAVGCICIKVSLPKVWWSFFHVLFERARERYNCYLQQWFWNILVCLICLSFDLSIYFSFYVSSDTIALPRKACNLITSSGQWWPMALVSFTADPRAFKGRKKRHFSAHSYLLKLLLWAVQFFSSLHTELDIFCD